jgi:hypothetical protein
MSNNKTYTVQELIEVLEGFDPDKPVNTLGDEGDHWPIGAVIENEDEVLIS